MTGIHISRCSTAESCRCWILQSSRSILHCIGRDDICCDVDENRKAGTSGCTGMIHIQLQYVLLYSSHCSHRLQSCFSDVFMGLTLTLRDLSLQCSIERYRRLSVPTATV